MSMQCVSKVVARPNVLNQVRKIQIERKDLTNKHSIAQGTTTKQNQYLEKILAGNRKWVDDWNKKDPDFFHKLGQPQKPKFLYFGCSDSRVPANQILGLK